MRAVHEPPLLPHHLNLIRAVPAFAQWHHEVGHECHLAELPLSILPHIFVIKLRGDEKTFAIENRLCFQIADPCAGVAGNGDDVIVNELFDERH